MPTGQTDKPVIEDNRDGTVSIKYDPREEGLHELYVKYNGEHVQGKIMQSMHWLSKPTFTLCSPMSECFGDCYLD